MELTKKRGGGSIDSVLNCHFLLKKFYIFRKIYFLITFFISQSHIHQIIIIYFSTKISKMAIQTASLSSRKSNYEMKICQQSSTCPVANGQKEGL